MHLEDVTAHVPGLPDVAEMVRKQLLSYSDEKCRNSDNVPDLKSERCEPLEEYQSSCSSMDLKVKTSFKLQLGEKPGTFIKH